VTPREPGGIDPPEGPFPGLTRTPSLGVVNLAVFGCFMLTAGLGSIVPHFVKDRLPDQFRPLWRRVLATPDEEWDLVGETVAVASQWVIGITELTAGALGLFAVFAPRKRIRLAQVGMGLATGLFGTFMVVLFFLHEAELPKWSQYPALLVWIAATWLLLERDALRRA